jgi:hypothetical protein
MGIGLKKEINKINEYKEIKRKEVRVKLIVRE